MPVCYDTAGVEVMATEKPADEPRYPIRAVVRLTGIPAATLRSWERRYGFPAPARSGTARRLYSGADLEAIRWLKAQAKLGLSIGQAVQWYQRGRAGAGDLAQSAHDETASHLPEAAAVTSRGDLGSLTQEMLGAVVSYDERRLESVLSTAFSLHQPDEILLNAMAPLLEEVGDLWARGQLPVTAEHFVTNVFRRRLFNLLGQLPVLNSAPPVVLACVPGEAHELGLLMLAVFLRWRGLHPLYLGANVPVGDLLNCLRQTRARVVCLSAVHVDAVPALIDVTKRIAGADMGVAIFVGGEAGVHAALAPEIQVPPRDLRDAAQTIADAAASRRAGPG
jgi:methanogenic corrinoid protein MtbC1